MALLGQIRERSIFLIIVIGMALFAFVISGVFTSDGGGGSISEPIAKVNDVEIDLDLFRFNVEQTERNYNFSTLKSVDAVWNQTIRNAVLENQYKILGIDAGTAQLEEIISSNDAFLNDQRFLNESGFFDFGLFTNFIISMKTNNPEGYENWKAQESQLISMAKQNIYLGLVRSSATFSDFEGKFAYHTENDNVSIEYVQIPYSLISDSMVSVSDNEIKKYITQNPDKFKRNETRSIDYVLFNEAPTEEDILEQRNSLEKLIGNRIEYNDVSKLTDTILGLKNTNDISGFVSQHSNIPFDSIYKSKGELVSEYSEILFNLNENKIFGPYIEGKNIKISKMIDQKKDGSIRASHILISYKESLGASNLISRSKEEAKQKAFEILRQIRRNPKIFNEAASKNSDGPSKDKGGDLGFFQEGFMEKSFFDFVNNNKVGKTGVVETKYGYHVIKITDKEDVVLLANVVQELIPSESTSNQIFKNATDFEIQALKSNREDFESIAENLALNYKQVDYLNILDEQIPGLGEQRQIIKWSFSDNSEEGDIKKFNLSSGGYAVVKISKIRDTKIAEFDEIKEEVRSKLVIQKKSDLLLKKYKSIKSIEELSKKSNQEIQTASALNQKNSVLSGSGQEPYIIGASFALKENEESNLLVGNKGLYKIKVTGKEAAPDLPSYLAYRNSLRTNENIRINSEIFNALKMSSEIEDNRHLYY
ncbi:MAG: hypothetical protein CBC76_02945 [Flavobacteriaceae bacterium TMED116]|nr:MAG: hypothetical protein CBC76_02945 [Flavobacteriaceae bacterium TMED116]